MNDRDIWIDLEELMVEFLEKDGCTISTWKKSMDENHFNALLEEIHTIAMNTNTRGFIIDARTGEIASKNAQAFISKILKEFSKDGTKPKQAFLIPDSKMDPIEKEDVRNNVFSRSYTNNAMFFNSMEDAIEWVRK